MCKTIPNAHYCTVADILALIIYVYLNIAYKNVHSSLMIIQAIIQKVILIKYAKFKMQVLQEKNVYRVGQ